jgi:methyl-accepting chemotaxis protein
MQDSLQQRLEFVGLGDGIERLLAPIAPGLDRHLDAALRHLSLQVAAAPSAARFLYGRDRIESDGGSAAAHWQALLAGQFDKTFVETATRTGQRHARIGVEPRWQAGSHAIIAQALIRGVVADGVAQIARARRGPLALLDLRGSAPDEMIQGLADAVAALVGAVLLDLDLTFSGYAERLRQDAEAGLAAEKSRLRTAAAQVGLALENAAAGQSDTGLVALDDPDLVPLRAGAEKLADRVSGLIEDLELSARAVDGLAVSVLHAARGLDQDSEHQVAQAGLLARALPELGPAVLAVSNGLGQQVRTRRQDVRHCRKGARDLGAIRDALAPMRQGKGRTHDGEVELDAKLEGVMVLLDRLGDDCSAEARALAALERELGALATAVSVATLHAAGLEARLVDGKGQGAAIEASIRQALEGSTALAGLAQTFNTPASAPQTVFPLPDHAALAAHWHVM